MDEALGLPTEAAARLALRTQQLIASESRVTQTVDPLAGSWFVESLTSDIEKRVFAAIDEIDRRGGTIKCIEAGYIQNEISNSAYVDQRSVDEGRTQVVGVNCYQDQGASAPVEILRISPDLEPAAINRVRAYRAKRNEAAAQASLKAIETGVKAGQNLMALIVESARAGATLGEIADSMRGVFGLYQEYSGF